MQGSIEKTQLESLISKMKKLFEFYCQWGEKMNTVILGYNRFMKLAEDCQIVDEETCKVRLELIYKSENKYNTLNFNGFLNVLIKVANWKFSRQENLQASISQQNKTKYLKMLIETYLMPRYDQIFTFSSTITSHFKSRNNTLRQDSLLQSKTTINSFTNSPISPNIEDCIFDKSIMEIFTRVAPILFDIYKVYFPHEISLADDLHFIREKSLKNFYLFLKEFDLYPGLVSKPLAFTIFTSEEEEKGLIEENSENYLKLIKNIDISETIKYYTKNGNILGRFFNFFKFLRSILKISQVSYENVEKIKNLSSIGSDVTNISLHGRSNFAEKTFNNSNFNFFFIPSYEKLILTIERMQLSEGFLKLQMKTNRTHSKRESLMISTRLLDTINANNSNNENSILFDKGMLTNRTDRSKIFAIQNNLEELCDFAFYIRKTYGEELQKIFKGFCSFGDPLNTKYMTSKIFMKFLKEAQLVMNIKNQSKLTYNLIFKNVEKSKLGLKITDVDIIFKRLSANSSYSTTNIFSKVHSGNKIEFNTFIIAIEVIARILLPLETPKKAIDIIIKDYIYKNIKVYDEKMNSLEERLTNLSNLKKDNDFAFILGLVSKSFIYVFNNYANNKGLMNFEQLLK